MHSPADVAAERERLRRQIATGRQKEQVRQAAEQRKATRVDVVGWAFWVAVVVGLICLGIYLYAVTSSWHHQQQVCERHGGVWLSGRGLHKCLYGDVRTTP